MICRLAAFLVVILAVFERPVQSQTLGTEAVPSIAEFQARLDGLGESEEAARALYAEAIRRLERAAASREVADQMRAEAAAAPEKLEQIRTELAQPASQLLPVVPDGATLSQLELLQAEAQEALGAARELDAQLLAETASRQERRSQIQELLPQKRVKLTGVEEALNTPVAPDSSLAVAEARRAALLAEYQELVAEIDKLEAERTSYEARRDLLPARRDQAARRVIAAESISAQWERLVGERRREEAKQIAQDAERLRRQAARQHPVLQTYAAETQALALQRTESDAIPQRIARTTQELANVKSSFATLRQRYGAVRQRIEASGLDRATGRMLRREYESLPDVSDLNRRVVLAERELEEIEFVLFERQDDRAGSDDIDRVRAGLLSQIDGQTEITLALESASTELVIARRDVLAQLEADADKYQDLLIELERESERLRTATAGYESFIRERILWVRSISNESSGFLADLGHSLASLSDGGTWSSAVELTRSHLMRRLPSHMIGLALLIGLFALGQWSKRRILAIAQQVGRYRTDSFIKTLHAVALTLAIAVPVPTVLWCIGRVLASPLDQVPIASAIGEALQAAGYLLLPALFVWYACKSDGLFAAHFRWPELALRSARRCFCWFTPVFVLSVSIVVAVEHFGEERVTSSLGRVAFTVAMIASTVLVFQMLRPRGRILKDFLARQPDSWISRSRFLWFPCLLAVPVTLASVSWMGFFYTATQLERKIGSSIGLLLLLGLANALLLRWLFIARRRVAVEDARRRREQALTAEQEGRATAESGPTESSVPAIDEDKLDLPAISLQTKQLFRTAIWVCVVVGLFGIWADVLPALKMLDRVQVYPTQQIVELYEDSTIPELELGGISLLNGMPNDRTSSSNEARADRSASPSTVIPLGTTVSDAAGSDEAGPIVVTLADIGLAIVVLLATLIAFRNLPGLVEIVILQRLPLDAGSRYALSTVLRYAIAIVGLIAAFSAVNIAWSNVQWLAAALTFGLAFGLQEIFANFISGLIILAERPIRIGDTVTVGQVSGTVTRIRMRATTITDWDRKELVIPNKTFITGDVINWTLSDPTLRVIIPVGVSYGADVHKAERLLVDIATKAPNVLHTPKPYVIFGNFGDSTLDFELRVFIPHIDQLLTVKHYLHMRIIEVFREASIEIAFPQRDLHLRSSGDLRDLIVGSSGPQDESSRAAER